MATPAHSIPEIVSTRVVHDGWGRFLVARVRWTNGQEISREIEDHGNVVAVLLYNPEDRTAVLVGQYRPPLLYVGMREKSLEAVAGLLEGDDPEDCARRESFEETGVRVGPLEFVGSCWSSPGVSTERMALYLAAFLPSDRTGKGGGLSSEHEDLSVVSVPLSELAAMADKGELHDLKTLVLVQTLRLRRPDLFKA
jgi:nudix-type nucleoside diphosphatase (YffH/AdpP family)